MFYQAFNEASHKGKQMLPGGSKTRSARQDGYFEKQFTRIMEAESYSDPVKKRRQEKLKQSRLNLGHAFVPSSGEKLAYVKKLIVGMGVAICGFSGQGNLRDVANVTIGGPIQCVVSYRGQYTLNRSI